MLLAVLTSQLRREKLQSLHVTTLLNMLQKIQTFGNKIVAKSQLQPSGQTAPRVWLMPQPRKPPDPSLGELDVALPLKRGETLLFFYSTKHAATPNLSDLERCLIYSVYGPVGVHDQQNHKGFLPSIFNITAEDARELDQFYQRQGYLISNQSNQGNQRSQSPSWAPLALAGLVASLMACLVLR